MHKANYSFGIRTSIWVDFNGIFVPIYYFNYMYWLRSLFNGCHYVYTLSLFFYLFHYSSFNPPRILACICVCSIPTKMYKYPTSPPSLTPPPTITSWNRLTGSILCSRFIKPFSKRLYFLLNVPLDSHQFNINQNLICPRWHSLCKTIAHQNWSSHQTSAGKCFFVLVLLVILCKRCANEQ